MVTKPKESKSEKDGAHQSIIREQVVQVAYTPRAPLTDEVEALARKVIRKFDLMLVLPTVVTFCEYQYAYH